MTQARKPHSQLARNAYTDSIDILDAAFYFADILRPQQYSSEFNSGLPKY